MGFWNYDEAKEFLQSTSEYPLVFKLSVGAGSANIFKVDSVEEGIYQLKRMFGKGIFPYTENEFKLKSMGELLWSSSPINAIPKKNDFERE